MTPQELQGLIDKGVEKALAGVSDKSIGTALFGGSTGGVQDSNVEALFKMANGNLSLKPGDMAMRTARYDPSVDEAMKCLGRIAIGIVQGSGSTEKALSFVTKAWPRDKLTQDIFTQQKAMTATDPTGGGFTVPLNILEPLIPFLYNRTAVRQLGATVINLPNGNGTVPRFDAISAASYVGEAKNPNATKPTLGAVKLAVKKLIGIIPLSNDLILQNSVGIETYVARDLITVMNLAADLASLYGSGIGENPLGIANQTGNQACQKTGTSTTTLDADQPAYMTGLLDQANVPMISPGWIMNGRTRAWIANLKTTTGAYIYREELGKGLLFGYPYVVSNQVPATFVSGTTYYSDLWLGDWSEFLWGEQTMLELRQSQEASFHDEAGNLVSAFDLDLTVMRAISRHDFNVKHGVSFVQGTYKLA